MADQCGHDTPQIIADGFGMRVGDFGCKIIFTLNSLGEIRAAIADDNRAPIPDNVLEVNVAPALLKMLLLTGRYHMQKWEREHGEIRLTPERIQALRQDGISINEDWSV